MAYRIECGIKYTDTDAIYLQYPASGATHTVKLKDTSAQSYTGEHIRSVLQAALQTVNAGFTVTQGTADTYTIAHSSVGFDLHFGYFQSIADFLGFEIGTATGISETGNPSPAIFEGARGCNVVAGFRWQLRRTDINHGQGRSVKLLKQDVYRVTLQVTRSELKRWYEVQRYMLQGHPFTLYQTKENGTINGYADTAFAKNAINGKILCQLDDSTIDIQETQVTQPYVSDVVVEFNAVAVTTAGGSL